MNTLLDTLKILNKHSLKINIPILILNIIIIAFVNVDVGFTLILILGALNLIYLILSIFIALKTKYTKSLFFSIINMVLVALSYYLGVLIILDKSF